MLYLAVTCRWLLALVFGFAAIAKWRDHDRAGKRLAVQRYIRVKDATAELVATGLPCFELLLAVALAVGILPTATGAAAGSVVLVFACFMAWHLIGGDTFDCGCGLTPTPISWRVVLRNLGFALVAIGAAAQPSGRLSGTQLLPLPMLIVLLAATSRIVLPTVALVRAQRRPSRTPVSLLTSGKTTFLRGLRSQ
jgi:hypothetical protein